MATAINAQFGSFDAFCTKFSAQTAAVQGSGWGWLGLNKETGKVAIATTANQDPLSTVGLVPLLGVDVWCVLVLVLKLFMCVTVASIAPRNSRKFRMFVF